MNDTPKRPRGRPRKHELAREPREWDFNLPMAARMFANAYIVSGFDEYGAVRILLDTVGKSRSDLEVANVARRAMACHAVQEEITESLKKAGLDDEHKKNYVAILWEWLKSPDTDLKQTAARILSKAFISERVQIEKPESLKIEGLEEGLMAMGLKSPVATQEEKTN